MGEYASFRREGTRREASPTESVEPTSQASDALRGLSYDAQRAALAPQEPGVQMKASSSAMDAQNVQAAAAHGVAQGGGSLPYRAEMEAAFGTSFANVTAHTGSGARDACDTMGAEAYASGSSIAFAEASPSKELVAHELTHVVQQRAGVQLSGGVGQVGDAYEQQADAVAARVASGQSATDVLDTTGADQATGAVQQQAVQCYRDYRTSGAVDSAGKTHWQAPGSGLRVSDDGTMAVAQDSIAGSQEMYVDSGRVSTANADLAAAKSPVALTEVSGSVSGGLPDKLEAGQKTLVRVMPFASPGSDEKLEVPDDCGNAARAVSGATAEGKDLHAYHTDAAGQRAQTHSFNPEFMKYEILVANFAAQIPDAGTIVSRVATATRQKSADWELLEDIYEAELGPAMEEIRGIERDFEAAQRELQTAKEAGNDDSVKAVEARIQGIVERYQETTKKIAAIHAKKVGGETVGVVWQRFVENYRIREALVAAIFAPYEALDEVKRMDFDQRVGINRYADPAVGEAYTISSGGAPMKNSLGDDIRTWNFHWGGVILKSTSGSDNMTLENYAGNERGDWYFQMYGVPTVDNAREGQTFQDQHKDTHRQHGESPTTLATEKR